LEANLDLPGLPKAEYAVGYFTEMGIGCRRDPLEANVWYVKAADQGDERAKQRIAAIRDAASGNTDAVASRVENKNGRVEGGGPTKQEADKGRGKRWHIF
jgi:TPR repeat protein